MISNTNQYEYSYKTAQAGHHHAYLTKPLIEMMSEILPPPPPKIIKSFGF